MMFQYGAARRTGLTLLQMMLLRLIEVKGPLSPSQLADLFGISRPAVTSSINTLEDGGWVVRAQTAGDRRSLTTSLTEQSRQALDQVSVERRQFLEKGLAGLSAAERAEFARTTRQLALSLRTLRAVDDPAARSP
jgi:DNA-binding MarR family transcriptional regulator